MGANAGPSRSVLSERITFDNFSGGDYGEYGGTKPPPGTFRAMNILVTADGALCPRPGWADRSPTNMPTGKVLAMTPTSTPTRDMMFIVGAKVYVYDLNTPSTTCAQMGSDLGATPTAALYPKPGTAEFYIVIPSDTCYLLDPPNNTIAPLTDAPAGFEIEVYGERLIVATEGNQIVFSAAADFNSWPAENFIDIGDNWTITALREQANHLSIFKSRGKHVLTGVPGVNPTVRKVERSLGVLHPGQVVIDENDRLWYIPTFHQNPASFDGAATQQLGYLKELAPQRDGDVPNVPLVLGVSESIGDRETSTLLITQGADQNKMLLFHNGVWTRHTTSVDISGMVRGGYTGDFYVTDGGDDVGEGKIYSNYFGVNRPGLASDVIIQPGDDASTPVDAWVTFPEYWATDGMQISVRDVTVDFEKYNTGTASSNHFDIRVTSLGRTPASTGDATPITYSWDEDTDAFGSEGDHLRDRVAHGFQSARGNGFEVSLQNIRGVKINSVTVTFNRWPVSGMNP